jgi:hypothetical protein
VHLKFFPDLPRSLVVDVMGSFGAATGERALLATGEFLLLISIHFLEDLLKCLFEHP